MPPVPCLNAIEKDESECNVYEDQGVAKNEGNMKNVKKETCKQRHISTPAMLQIMSDDVEENNIRRVSSISGLHNVSYHPFQGQFTRSDGAMILQMVIPTSLQGNCDEVNVNNSCLHTCSASSDSVRSNLKKRCPIEATDSARGKQRFNNHNIDISNFNNNLSASSEEISDLGHCSKKGKQTQDSQSDTNTLGASARDKSYMFQEYLTKILSCIYAVFIVTLGIVVYLSDAITKHSLIAEVFSMYLILVALAYVLFLTIDIRFYLDRKKKYTSAESKGPAYDSTNVQEIQRGESHFSASVSTLNIAEISPTHDYCFSKGRHSGSFFLKLGAAVFCLGHLIHCGILVGYQIVFLNSKGNTLRECASVITLVLDIFYPIYSFLLLYFIFKYSNVIINRREALARFGFMHCISTSVCFWVWTILREITDALYVHKLGNTDNSEIPEEYTSAEDENNLLIVTTKMFISPPAINSKEISSNLVNDLNPYLRMSFSKCESENGITFIYENLSPYLYPFSVEFNILVVGILFIVWQNIFNCNHCDTVTECKIPEADSEESNLVIYADCHSSNRGLFSGIVVFVVCVINIILFFIGTGEEDYKDIAQFIVVLTDIILLSLLTVVCILAYRQITRLDINGHPISLLDDMLLFICIPAFLLNAIFSIIPSVINGSIQAIILIVVKLLQMLVQTPLIIDGLRRCSNSKMLRQAKPGRELITFLIVCNVSLWITQTFKIKSYELQDHKYQYYGKVLWTILGHTTLPLIMFYRFHAAVCLVDIWKSAYEPEQH